MNITKENLKEYAEKLIKGIDKIEPMTFPFKLENVKPREDEKIEVIDTEIALSNAKEKVGTEVKVPKVVE